MGFDSVFNTDPTISPVPASGNASLGINTTTGQLYYRDLTSGGWKLCAGSQPGGFQPFFQTATLTLTNAQVVATSNSATKYQIVPAPGVGKLINVINTVLEWVPASATGLNVGEGDVTVALYQSANVFPTTNLQIYSTTSAAGFLDQTTTTMVGTASTFGDESDVPSSLLNFSNTPIVFASAAVLSGGNANSILRISVVYNIIPV